MSAPDPSASGLSRPGTLSALWGRLGPSSSSASTSTSSSSEPNTQALSSSAPAPAPTPTPTPAAAAPMARTASGGTSKRRKRNPEVGQSKLVRNEQGWGVERDTTSAVKRGEGGASGEGEGEAEGGGGEKLKGPGTMKKKRGRPRKKVENGEVREDRSLERSEGNTLDGSEPSPQSTTQPPLLLSSPEIIELVSSDAPDPLDFLTHTDQTEGDDIVFAGSQSPRKRPGRAANGGGTTKPAHPFFSKPVVHVSTAATAITEEPTKQGGPSTVTPSPAIAVEEDKGVSKGPKRILFASDATKPAHSFFSRPTQEGTSVTASPQESAATVLSGSSVAKGGKLLPNPGRGRGVGPGSGAVHSFFTSGAGGGQGVLRNGWGKDKEEQEVLWPRGGWPSHQGGFVERVTTRVERREKIRVMGSVEEGYWLDLLAKTRASQTQPSRQRLPKLNELDNNASPHSPPSLSAAEHDEHPAITSVPNKARGVDLGKETWCDVFRPRKAVECLGNEKEAGYLRDWLYALQVGTTDNGAGGARRVIRRVSRKRRGNPDTSWIVDDVGLFGEPIDDQDDFDDFDENAIDDPPESAFSTFGPRPSTFPDLSRRVIANTIVLVGPCGVGKSAAVYAAAEEMGWEVFEVYTGTGKRTGAGLVTLVGDVGKNHMVGKGAAAAVGVGGAGGIGKGGKNGDTEAKGKEKNGPMGLASFFKPKEGADDKRVNKVKEKPVPPTTASQGSADDPIDIDEEEEVPKRRRRKANRIEDEDEDEDDFEVVGGGGEVKVSIDEDDSDVDGDVEVVEQTKHVEVEQVEQVEEKQNDADEDPVGSGHPTTTAASTATGTRPQQSLILIDEADILYEDESTFWPTLIAIIAESKRPVVLTCNDITRIPISSLPIQTVLRFDPPPIALAQIYLSAIDAFCIAAKPSPFSISDRQLRIKNLCEQVMDHDVGVDQPLPPNGNEPVKRFDLRRAITQMQLDRGKSDGMAQEGEGEEGGGLNQEDGVKEGSDRFHVAVEEMRREAKRLDVLSFVDAWVAPRPWAKMDMIEVDRFGSGPDDEDGIHQLLKPDIHHWVAAVPAYDGTRKVVDEIERLDGRRAKTEPLVFAQTNHVRALLPLLDDLVPLSSYLLPHPTLFTDLVPYVTHMVEMDDIFETAAIAAIAAGEKVVNRRTGRPMRITSYAGFGDGNASGGGYERWIQTGEEGLEVARKVRKAMQ